jgi:4a-hydroxytetrahydrobiopterin dehydratase
LTEEANMSLARESCVPCRGGEGALAPASITALASEVPAWRLADDRASLQRKFGFRDFVQAMAFVNRMAEIAEQQGHHPDFTVRYKDVDVSLSTHDVGGLSRNDFILAAKIDEIAAAPRA